MPYSYQLRPHRRGRHLTEADHRSGLQTCPELSSRSVNTACQVLGSTNYRTWRENGGAWRRIADFLRISGWPGRFGRRDIFSGSVLLRVRPTGGVQARLARPPGGPALGSVCLVGHPSAVLRMAAGLPVLAVRISKECGRPSGSARLRDETAGGQPVSLAAHDGPVPAASPPGLCESTPWVDAAPLRQVFTSVPDLTLSR